MRTGIYTAKSAREFINNLSKNQTKNTKKFGTIKVNSHTYYSINNEYLKMNSKKVWNLVFNSKDLK